MEHLQPLSDTASDNITYFIKLTSCVPEMYFNQMNNQRLVCNKCCETMNAVYTFRERCLRSKTMLTNYISQLHQVSNISGAAKVYITDINKCYNIKKECEKENNIIKTEMLINVDEDANEEENFEINPITEIKKVNNPLSFKLIENRHNYIQLENGVIKIEQENQNSEEKVEESFHNLLVNQDDIKIDATQNDTKLLASRIKNENEYQGFNEHLHERFDNILEMCDSENDNVAVKVEESNDYPLYLEKCFDHSLTNLDEIKIDIVENDIESINGEIYIQNKNENIQEFSTENNVISLKDQDKDKADKEINISQKTLEEKQKKTSLSKKPKQQTRLGVVNQKVKIVRKYECNICTKKFPQPFALASHIRSHTKEKPFECSICQEKFRYAYGVREHIKIHTGEKPYECEECRKKFANLSSLKMHMKIHSGEKPHECSICQMKFIQSGNLKKHMIRHITEKTLKCEVCEKKFGHISTLNDHKKIHTMQKRHECDVCQRKFGQAHHLREHMRIHTGEKPHECSVCQKKFTQSSSLRGHMKIHTGEKTHECDVCQKKFGHLSSMKEHKNIHTGKTHKCDVCPKKFSHFSTLKKHKKIHTGEKMPTCNVCQKKFVYPASLKMHLKIHIEEITA